MEENEPVIRKRTSQHTVKYVDKMGRRVGSEVMAIYCAILCEQTKTSSTTIDRCRRTLELFQRQRGETSERRDGAHIGFSERIDTILSPFLTGRMFVREPSWFLNWANFSSRT